MSEENRDQLFVWGTLKKGTHWYKTLVEPYIVEEETEETSIQFTRIGHAAIFRFGGVETMPGYVYTLNPDADLEEMWDGLDRHEGAPLHFRLITLENGWYVYEYNYDVIASTWQVKEKAERELEATSYGS